MFFLFGLTRLHAQTLDKSQYVDVIDVPYNKTSFLLINGVTTPLNVLVGGNAGYLFYDSISNSNIISLKAASGNGFPETNVLIVAQDTVLQFLLRYNANPAKTYWVYNFEIKGKEKPPVQIEAKTDIRQKLEDTRYFAKYSKFKSVSSHFTFGKSNGAVKLQLLNIFADNDSLYYVVKVNNQSKINYDLRAFYMFVKSKIKNPNIKTTTQTLQLDFSSFVNNPNLIKYRNEEIFCLSTKLFAIKDDETVGIVITENSTKSSGRMIEIAIKPEDYNRIIHVQKD